jgi:ribosomal protein S18 acetylase RimI-like enzyme
MSDYTIRAAQPDDLHQVVVLTRRWAEEETSTTGHYPVNAAQQLAQRIGSYFWVAERGEAVIGFVLGSSAGQGSSEWDYQVVAKGESYLEIDQLYVHPQHRSRGVGSRLVERLREEARSRGINQCVVAPSNREWERTIGFYEKLGFRCWYFRMFAGASTDGAERPRPGGGDLPAA